MEETMQKSSDW